MKPSEFLQWLEVTLKCLLTIARTHWASYACVLTLLLPTKCVNLRKIKLAKKVIRFRFFCMAAYGQKGSSLFLRPEKTQGFYLNIPAYLHCCCKQRVRISEKSTWGKSYEVLKFFAWRLMSKKGLRLVHTIFALLIFSFIRHYTCIVAGHTVCEFQKNRNMEKSQPIPVMQILGKMAKKLARGAISKFCFHRF